MARFGPVQESNSTSSGPYSGGGSTSIMQAKVGISGIAANDLVQFDRDGKLFPVRVSDFAAVPNVGSAVVARTVLSSLKLVGSAKKALYFDSVDACSYAAIPLTSDSGLTVMKLSSAGAVLGSVTLDAVITTTLRSPCLTKLANGNFVAVWEVTTAGSLYFAIFDKYLNVVVAKTLIDTADIVTYTFDVTALSGGGFAVAYSKNNPFLAIYSNAGAVVLAGSALTNTATFGVAAQSIVLTQLSNNNIAVAIGTNAAAKKLGYAITTAAGVSVVGCTMVNTVAGAVNNNAVAISALPGFFCCTAQDSSNTSAYVLSNAGVIQGAPLIDVGSTTVTVPRLINDGTFFWLAYNTSQTAVVLVCMPVTGVGYVASNLATVLSTQAKDFFYDRGYIVCADTANAYVMSVSPTNKLTLVSSLPINPAGSVDSMAIFAGGDSTLVLLNTSSTSTSVITLKYANTSIAGVALQAVAPGNDGSVLPFITGSGGLTNNGIIGSPVKTFDQSAANIIGNRGMLFSNSVLLKGYS